MLIHKTVAKAVAMAAHSAKDGTRYRLKGVKVEKEGTVVATDGHMLLAATVATNGGAPEYPPTAPTGLLSPLTAATEGVEGFIPTEALTGAVKAIGKRQAHSGHDHLCVTSQDEHLRLTAIPSKGSASDVTIDQSDEVVDFPQWRKVTEGPETQEPVTLRVCFGATLLARLAKAAIALSNTPSVVMEFRQTPVDALAPEKGYTATEEYTGMVSVRLEADTDVGVTVTGALMPMRPKTR